jgi:hypothetical protein
MEHIATIVENLQWNRQKLGMSSDLVGLPYCIKQKHKIRVSFLAYGYQECDISQQRQTCEIESFQNIACL